MLWKMLELSRRLYVRGYTAFIRSLGASIGSGSRIRPPFITDNPGGLVLAEQVVVHQNATMYVGRGCVSLGVRSHCAPFCYFLSSESVISIGDHVAIGPFTSFFAHSNYYNRDKPSSLFVDCHVDKDIRIGNNVFIGSHVVFLPGAEVEGDVVVAAGAVVSGKLSAGWVYGGIPARPIKRICEL